jgi:hypothetical protein
LSKTRFHLSSATGKHLEESNYSITEPEATKIMEKFPFQPHVPRLGEPTLPPYDDVIKRGAVHSGPRYDQRMEWFRWSIRQPDYVLLTEDYRMRGMWAGLKGNVPQETIDEWKKIRKTITELLQEQNKDDILKQYWPQE